MNTDKRCLFVIGCPRSGTSALSWGLAQHPELWTSAESDYLFFLFGQSKLREAYRKAYERPDRGWLKKHEVGYPEFAAAIGAGIDGLYRSRSGGLTWIDASPGYTLMAEDIAALFPEARFLHLIRDGRAVVNSMLNSGFSSPWASNFELACSTWEQYVRAGLAFERAAPQRVHQVRHETLVEDPAATVAGILDFLGLPPSTAPAEFLARKRINSSYDNRRPGDIRAEKDTARLKQRPWEGWSASKRATFAGLAGALTEELGYSLSV